MLRAYEGQKQGTQGTHSTHTHTLCMYPDEIPYVQVGLVF